MLYCIYNRGRLLFSRRYLQTFHAGAYVVLYAIALFGRFSGVPLLHGPHKLACDSVYSFKRNLLEFIF